MGSKFKLNSIISSAKADGWRIKSEDDRGKKKLKKRDRGKEVLWISSVRLQLSEI